MSKDKGTTSNMGKKNVEREGRRTNTSHLSPFFLLCFLCSFIWWEERESLSMVKNLKV
jgi:hypothetical protein